jgi:hypothetical protein
VLERRSHYVRHRASYLRRASRNFGFFFRLAADLHHLGGRSYEHAARTLDEIGRFNTPTKMVGMCSSW